MSEPGPLICSQVAARHAQQYWLCLAIVSSYTVFADTRANAPAPAGGDDAVAEPEAEPEAEPTVAEPEAEPTTVEEAEAEVRRLKALKAKIRANMEDDTKIDPEGIDTDKIKANFKKGRFVITLPKSAEARRAERKIAVKAD